MADKQSIAALIVSRLTEQDDASMFGGYVSPATNSDGSPDLTDVTIDGHYNLEAIAEAVITEIRSEYE
jgi:hypothetical protein